MTEEVNHASAPTQDHNRLNTTPPWYITVNRQISFLHQQITQLSQEHSSLIQVVLNNAGQSVNTTPNTTPTQERSTQTNTARSTILLETLTRDIIRLARHDQTKTAEIRDLKERIQRLEQTPDKSRIRTALANTRQHDLQLAALRQKFDNIVPTLVNTLGVITAAIDHSRTEIQEHRAAIQHLNPEAFDTEETETPSTAVNETRPVISRDFALPIILQFRRSNDDSSSGDGSGPATPPESNYHTAEGEEN